MKGWFSTDRSRAMAQTSVLPLLTILLFWTEQKTKLIRAVYILPNMARCWLLLKSLFSHFMTSTRSVLALLSQMMQNYFILVTSSDRPAISFCRNRSSYCYLWAYVGYCRHRNEGYTKYMQINCRKSCNLCWNKAASHNRYIYMLAKE